MSNPKITIVTVCYNSELTIVNTIESIVKQDYDNFEYVIVDGNSTDRTMEIVKKYENQYPFIIAISEPDNGIADAFNKGIRMATGELIALINSDDALAEGALQLVAETYDRTNADVIYGDTIVIDKKNGLRMIKKGGDVERIKYEMPFIHQSCHVKKSAYDMWGGYNSEYKICMDYDLIARLYANGCKFAYADGVLSVFSYGGTSCEHPFRTINENFLIARKHGLTLIEEIPYRTIITVRNLFKIILEKLGLWGKLSLSIKKDNLVQ